MPFQSQAQQRFAFGTDQPWAKRWADEADFSKLPKRVRRVRSRRLKGCTCGQSTKEQLSPGVTRIRGNLCNVHGKYGPCDAAASGKKPKGGKGRAAAKPKKTEQQRQQERETQHAQNRADVLSKMNIAPDGQEALSALRQGGQPDPAAIARGGFEQAGLVERGRDGAYRLTASGRAALSAADAGDLGRAGATIGAARDRVSERAERLAKRKPKGGGKGKKQPVAPAVTATPAQGVAKPPSAAEQRAEVVFQQRQQDRQSRIARQQQGDTERAARRQEAAQRRSAMDARRAAADARRQAAEARAGARAESAANRTNRSATRRTKAETYGGVKRTNLDDSVFAGPDRSFPIKTAQDVRDAVRSLGRTKHDKAAVRRGIIRRARAIGATNALPESWKTKETFTVYKDASGADRWISVSSTAYRDRDREIVSTKALSDAVALADASGYRGPLRFWHVPGHEFGDCDFQATAQDSRFLIESGTFRSPALAAAVKARADGYQVSVGFTHPANEPDPNGVFSHIAIFERSLVPKGRASNPFTTVALATKETRMLTSEKASALKELLGNEALLNSFLGQVATTDKAAQDGGVAYKDDQPPAWAASLITRIEAIETSLKSTAETVTEDVTAKDDGDMEAMAAEGGMDEASLEPDGDENMLNPAEIAEIANAVVAAIVPHLDIEKKMAGHLNEMKGLIGGMGATKDAALAEVKEQLKTVTEQVADLNGSQPRILSGGYRASQSPATVTTDEKLKDAAPQSDPKAASFAAFLQDMGLGGQSHA